MKLYTTFAFTALFTAVFIYLGYHVHWLFFWPAASFGFVCFLSLARVFSRQVLQKKSRTYQQIEMYNRQRNLL